MMDVDSNWTTTKFRATALVCLLWWASRCCIWLTDTNHRRSDERNSASVCQNRVNHLRPSHSELAAVDKKWRH